MTKSIGERSAPGTYSNNILKLELSYKVTLWASLIKRADTFYNE
jgi:hypothetical protein